MKPNVPLLVVACVILAALAPVLRAQPSGGPYGPQPQTYEVPKDAAHVYYVAPDGKADAPGTSVDAPTTIESAIARVVTGDAIILRGGTYRTGGLLLSQGITLQPFRDEKPVLKGTRVAAKWESLREGVWRTKWETLFPSRPRDWWRREREGMRTPQHRFNNDMVFVDGVALKSAGWEGELDDKSYYIDYESGHVYVRFDPTNRLVEITAWDIALNRTSKAAHGKPNDRRGPVIRGIIFTQYAYRALEVEGKRGAVPATEEPTDDPVGVVDPETIGKEVVGTVLEHCTITHCSRVGGYFRGDRLVIRNCLVSDTSTEGIYVIGSADCLLERNLIARNNVEQLTGYYPSAVKIFNQTRRVVVRDNVVIDNPHSNGVWYDVGNIDGVFVNNWVEGCIDGFFFEISKGVTCAGNVFVNCTNGIRILNSRDARVYQNTFHNAPAWFVRDQRSATADHFAWHPATGPDVHERDGHVFAGNLLVAGAGPSRPLLHASQAPVLKARLTSPQFAATGANVYVRPTGPGVAISWSPAAGEANAYEMATVAELQAKLPGFEQGSVDLPGTAGEVLRSPELRNYAPSRALPAASKLPAEVVRLLGWPARDSYVPGAYQPAR